MQTFDRQFRAKELPNGILMQKEMDGICYEQR